MPAPAQSLSPTQIGYLRNAPSSESAHRAVTGPLKGMLNKFAALGFVEIDDSSRFRRSDKGDEAVGEFDAHLSPYHFETLQMAADGDRNVHKRKGSNTLVKADLLYVRMSDGGMGINDNGRRVLKSATPSSPKP